MAKILRSRLGLAAVATAASLTLHAAVLSIAIRRIGSPPEAPAGPRVVLSLAGGAPTRLAAVETPAFPADEPPAAPPLPAPIPTESLPEAAAAVAPPPPPAPAIAAPAPATDSPVAAEMREASPAPDPAAPPSVAEAAPPASLPSPPDLPAVAEAPEAGQAVVAAAGSAPLARPAQPPAETLSAVALASSDPPVALPNLPSAPEPLETSPPPAAALPRPLAEAAPPVTLSPLPDAVVPAGPPPAGDARAEPVESVPPPTPPPPADAVRAPDTAVAALEPPSVSAERVRAFVDRYDGGPCFFASVAGTSPTDADVETFSTTVDQVMAFHSAFMGQIGVEPHVVGQRVWSAQCPAVEFLRRTRSNGFNPLRISLNAITLSDGGVLSGRISGSAGRHLSLYIVSETGSVEDLSAWLRDRGEVDVFTVPVRHPKRGGPFPQIILATAMDLPDRTGPTKPPRTLSDLMTQSFGPQASEIWSVGRLILLQ